MMVRVEVPGAGPAWRNALMRPVVFAGGLIVLAALLSLIALVYLSWSSALRLDPLERHLHHLRNLQFVNLEVQTALVDGIRQGNSPDPRAIEEISLDLKSMLREDDYLLDATPGRVREALNDLLRSDHDMQENLEASFDLLRQALHDESEAQHDVIVESRRNARREFTVALFSLFAVPVVLVAILLTFRRRLFAWSSSLSEMLENVRQSNLDPVRLPDPADAMYPVIGRYNAMVDRLREIEAEHVGKEQDLEHQVQVASDSLLRVQRSLSQAEQLSAIGEFSARIAHELRNPLSGITVALRNLRREEGNADKSEVIDLVLDEIERISRLLDSLLARTPRERERWVPTNLAGLCRDMIRLFGYEADVPIDYHVEIPEYVCDLPRDTLRQAVLNILRNSAQAMGPSGGRIAISGEVSGDRFTLVIEDSGPGYPDDILQGGIRPFRTNKVGGSGLGLSILQRLIHNAGGRLRLGSARGGGARTEIELPGVKAHSEGTDA